MIPDCIWIFNRAFTKIVRVRYDVGLCVDLNFIDAVNEDSFGVMIN